MDVSASQNDAAASDIPRDADRMELAPWPQRALPEGVAGREPRFQVVFADAVLQDIRDHGLSSPEIEVCGVLVGNIYHDASGPYCHIRANIRGNHAEGRNAQVTFTADTWTHIQQTMDSQYPDDRIVGWYHTHPGFGIFLSGMDLFIQENFFGEPWQVAFVDDPIGTDRGVFVWEQNVSVRRPHLVAITAPPTAPAAPPAPAMSPMDALIASARARTAQRRTPPKRSRNLSVLFILLVLIAAAAVLFWHHFARHLGFHRP